MSEIKPVANMLSLMRKKVKEQGYVIIDVDAYNQLQEEWIRRVPVDESALAQARREERERCAKYKDGLTESMKAIDSMQKRHSAYRAATEKGIGLARLYLNAGETMRAIKALNDACDQMDEADRIRALSDTDERTEK